MPTIAPVQALLARGAQCMRERRMGEAIDAYAQAVTLDPAQADAWFNLAWAQRADRRFDAALGSYARALGAGIDRPEEVHLNRAAILSDHLFRVEEAEHELRAAIARAPTFLQAWLNLGNLYEDLGQADAARDAYHAALRIAPGNGRAHARLGTIDVATGAAREAAARLTQTLPSVTDVEGRAEMLFALGAALDALARHDDAFQAYEAANWLARSAARTRYDPAAQEGLVDHIIAAFPVPLPNVTSATARPAPVFICGMFRSGSTLLEQLLGRHPQIEPGGEREFIPALARQRLQPYPEAAARLGGEEIRTFRAQYLAEFGGDPARLWTDKRCDNFLHIGLIKTLFPESRIVHTVRQPLDNLLSVYFLHFGDEVSYGHDLREAAHYYVQYRRLMAHWRRLFPDDIHDVAYEQVVTDPARAMGELLAFLGLPWDDAVLRDQGMRTPVRTASAWAVRQPLHARSSGRWRHYERHLTDARALLAAAGV